MQAGGFGGVFRPRFEDDFGAGAHGSSGWTGLPRLGRSDCLTEVGRAGDASGGVERARAAGYAELYAFDGGDAHPAPHWLLWAGARYRGYPRVRGGVCT